MFFKKEYYDDRLMFDKRSTESLSLSPPLYPYTTTITTAQQRHIRRSVHPKQTNKSILNSNGYTPTTPLAGKIRSVYRGEATAAAAMPSGGACVDALRPGNRWLPPPPALYAGAPNHSRSASSKFKPLPLLKLDCELYCDPGRPPLSPPLLLAAPLLALLPSENRDLCEGDNDFSVRDRPDHDDPLDPVDRSCPRRRLERSLLSLSVRELRLLLLPGFRLRSALLPRLNDFHCSLHARSDLPGSMAATATKSMFIGKTVIVCSRHARFSIVASSSVHGLINNITNDDDKDNNDIINPPKEKRRAHSSWVLAKKQQQRK